jgi:hypothetical protein
MGDITTYLPALLVTSMLIAWLSYRFIEQPIRNRTVISQRAVLISSTAITALLILSACTGLWQNGFDSRYSQEVISLDKARAPKIPFVQCDEKSPGNWCLLGKLEKNRQ